MQFFYNYCSTNPVVREQPKIQHFSAAPSISPEKVRLWQAHSDMLQGYLPRFDPSLD